jgi:hypothetical protein
MHQEVCSTYHIYHKKERHACISPSINPSKERFWGPTLKEQKEKKRQRLLEEIQKKIDPVTTDLPSPKADDDDDDAFFLHSPYLAFHDPPQVLYIGNTKRTVPAVLIHSSLFWRKWKLQLGPAISQPGVLDPRGVVCWRHNGGDGKARTADDKLLKGYKVRTWRLWGETGKDYVHSVKANREAGIGPDPDVVEDDNQVDDTAEKDSNGFDPGYRNAPARAEEVVYLNWTSPFSRNTRQYHFRYAGLDFYWKGTGTVKETRKCGFFLHFNHLKLVAQLPSPAGESQGERVGRHEVCLGKYTSSIATQKSGNLDLYDGAMWRLMAEHMPCAFAEVQQGVELAKNDSGVESAVAEIRPVKKTRLYQVVVATAMCMIIGEKQKRDTVRRIIEALITEGGGGGGG